MVPDRHNDGTKHRYQLIDKPLPKHDCGTYCFHYLTRCIFCKEERIGGFSL